MRRRQLVELEDLSWCPAVVRDGGTDWLAFMANGTGVFSSAAVRLRQAMRATNTTRIVDLCSGSGGPWVTLERELAANGPVQVELTDRFPNQVAADWARARSGNRLQYRRTPVDATDVPAELEGVRTMFNGFHHFPPDLARGILADAVRKRRAIAIFEAANRRDIALLAMPLQLPAILLLTPLVRPFTWSRLFFTYLVPLIPAIVLFDGVMSFLRLYLEDDLRELVQSVPGHETFDWDIGSTGFVGRFGVTHLVGIPRDV
jgi:hypothetical protein